MSFSGGGRFVRLIFLLASVARFRALVFHLCLLFLYGGVRHGGIRQDYDMGVQKR